MKLAHRNLSDVWGAVREKRHYTALRNMFRLYDQPAQYLYRYLTAKGSYPHRIRVKTPLGVITPTLYSFHDLLTVNEIFCRGDYALDYKRRVVLDIGSNIGLSALYFLTRNANNRVYLYEPDPKNVVRLRENLRGYEERYHLSTDAVGPEGGTLSFGLEPTGRYGGLGMATGQYMDVTVRAINDVLADILAHEARLDVVKIDTEGIETATIEAIDPSHWPKIGTIFFEEAEAARARALRPDLLAQFSLSHYGLTHILRHKVLPA